MKLPTTTNKVKLTLYFLIKNSSITSVSLARLTSVGYPPRKIQILEQVHGVRIFHSLDDYTCVGGKRCKIARYMLLTPKKEAISIYEKLTS